MAVTFTDNGTNTPNGTHKEFGYTFPTIKTDGTDVKVALNGQTQATSKYAVNTTNTKITFNNTSIDSTLQESDGAPKTGVVVRVYRDTLLEDADTVTFVAGSSIRAQDLNANFNQSRYALQEEQTNTINSEDITDGAVTYAKIQDVSATDRVLGRDSAGAGDVEEITPAALRTMINVEDGATADQSNAEIRAAVEAASDSNVFTDADHTKLNGIEASATADQSNAEIRAAVEAATDSNVFTDADHTKLNGIEASATADQTASEIKSLIASSPLDSSHLATDSVTTSEIADAELTTLAGMQSGTASILAGGTALTATLAEINTVVDGKGVHTTISDSDAHYPTSGAVVDYVAAQIAPIGGLEVIANKDAFPETQPASGVVISIADAAGIVVNGSDTSTTCDTISSDATVTINNINSSFRSSTVASGIGWLVTSTGSGQIYNYHKANIKESDVVQLSDDINDFNSRYRVNAGEPGSNNDEGDLVYDTNADKMKVYDSSTSAWKEVTSTGDFKYLVMTNPGTTNAATLTNSTFDLKETSTSGSAASITSAAQLIVSVNGVIQKANAGTSAPAEGFALSDADTIVFSSAPGSGASVFIIQIGSAVTIPTPGDNTVATAKIQNLAVNNDKIANDTISEVKLDVSNAPTNGQFLQAQSGEGGGLTWATVSSSDATKMPLAGGTFTGDVTWDNGTNAGKDMIWDESDDTLKLNDDVQISLGSDRDVRLYHTGSHGYINVVTGDLNIRTNGSESAIVCTKDAGVALYYDAAKKFETVTGGATITGTCTATAFAGDGSALTGIAAGATGGNSGGNAVFWENAQNVTHDYTITNGKNAGSFGPITIDSGATVTIGDGEYWTIV